MRCALIVSFNIEGQRFLMANVHLPTSSAAHKADEAAHGDIAGNMQELTMAPGCTITLMGDYTCEWLQEMATQGSGWTRGSAPHGISQAAALAAFAEAWTGVFPECAASRRCRSRFSTHRRIQHDGRADSPRGTDRKSDHRALRWMTPCRAGSLIQFDPPRTRPLHGWIPSATEAS